MNIGEKIKTIRLKKGETLEEFGETLGATKVSVHNWESGRNLPSKRRLKRIAELGNTTVEEFTQTKHKHTGEKIRRIRLDRKETLEEFGKHLNAGKSNVSRWEKGENLPSAERLMVIAELGNTTVEELTEPEPIDQLTERILKTYSKEQVQDIIVKLVIGG